MNLKQKFLHIVAIGLETCLTVFSSFENGREKGQGLWSFQRSFFDSLGLLRQRFVRRWRWSWRSDTGIRGLPIFSVVSDLYHGTVSARLKSTGKILWPRSQQKLVWTSGWYRNAQALRDTKCQESKSSVNTECCLTGLNQGTQPWWFPDMLRARWSISMIQGFT